MNAMRNVWITAFFILSAVLLNGQIIVDNNSGYNVWRNATNCSGASWNMPAVNSFADAIYRANAGEDTRIEFDASLAGQTITFPGGLGWLALCGNGITIDGSNAPGLTIAFDGGSTFIVTGNNNVLTNLNFQKTGNQHGIFITGSGNTVENSTFTRVGAADYMMFYMAGATTTGNIVQNNEISGPNKSAIEVRDGASSNQFIGNEISGFFNLGIALSTGTVDGTLIDGNAIHSGVTRVSFGETFYPTGIAIYEASHTNTVIINNIIGSDFTRADGIGGILGNGISILNGTSVTIGRAGEGNHIVGCGNADLSPGTDTRGRGVYIEAGSVDIKGNVIGVDWTTKSITGTYGNDMSGVFVGNGTGTAVTAQVVVGGTGAGEGNVIGNNGFGHTTIPRSGVMFEVSNGNSSVVGNYLGVNESGDAIGNRQEGVTLYTASNVTVKDNEIANNANGVAMRVGTSNITIEGNDIHDNTSFGISVEGSSSSVIGGATESLGNLIYANGGSGINLGNDWTGASSTNIEMYWNKIGNFDGARTENTGNAIYVSNGSQLNTIGAPGQGNVIKNKTVQNAIVVDGATAVRNRIQGNETSGNQQDVIAHANDGNFNYGSNNAVTFNSGEARANTISGRAPAVGDIIDIYVSIDGQCGTGVPQGAVYVASVTAFNQVDYSIDYSGPIWEYDLTSAEAVAAGLTIDNAVVTATQGTGTNNLSTSEFASCLRELSCTFPTAASITDPGVTDFCDDAGAGSVTLTIPLEAGFEYIWFEGSTIVQAQSANNTFVVTESGTYTVQIVDPVDPTTCFVDADNSITLTKRDNPTVDGTIDGDEEVCLTTASYTLTGQTANYDEIIWSTPLNNGAAYVGSGEGETVSIDFSGVTDVDVDVEFSLTLYKIYDNNVVCASDASDLKVVDVVADPEVTFDSPSYSVICGTTGNAIVTITDYDVNNTYNFTDNGGITVTGPDASGVVTLDAAADARGGVINVIVTNATGCTTSGSFDVVVTGCGRRVVQNAPDSVCAGGDITLDGSATFAGDGVDNSNSSYRWTIVQQDPLNTGLTFSPSGVVEGVPADVEFLDITTTGTPGLGPWRLIVTLEVAFENDPGNYIPDTDGSDTIVIFSNPDASWSIVEDQGECFGDTVKYQVTPFDDTKYVYSDLVNLADSTNGLYAHENGAVDYTSSLTVSNISPNLACSVTLSELREIKLRPTIDIVSLQDAEEQYCDLNSFDSLYRFVAQDENVESFTWSIVEDPSFTFQSAVNGDTIDIVFPEDLSNASGAQQFTLLLTGNLSADACSTDPTIEARYTINVDRSYLVDVTASPIEDLYCEGDSGMFRGVFNVDSSGDYGTGVYAETHYGELFWDYHTTVFNQKYEIQQDNQRYIIDTFLIGGFEAYLYSDDFVTFYNDILTPVDTSDVYAEAIDTSYTRNVGVLQFGDSLIFRAEPQHCVHYQSILSDTLLGDSILQAKTEIDVLVNQEGTHVIDNVISTPLVDVSDDANNGIADGAYFLFQGIGGDTSYIANSLFVGDFDNVEVPEGETSVLYIMVLEQGVCRSIDTAQLILNYGIFIPDMFSPNGDGFYDELVIENIDQFPNNKVEIYNRWGSLLYETNDYSNNQWDGTHKGNELPVASYYVVVDLGNGSDPISQTVSIFK